MEKTPLQHLADKLPELTALRHTIHQHPDLSGQEGPTVKRLLEFFTTCPPDEVIQNIGGHGFAVVYNSKNVSAGPTSLFTCELDAIPVQEKNTAIEYASTVKGAAHLCGHDGHMASLAALGVTLAHKRPETGRVVLLFRPQEENGRGAPLVIADPKFSSIEPDYVFGYHNLTGYPSGSIVVTKGQFAWTASDFNIELTGRASHGGMPEDAVSPRQALLELISWLEDWRNWPDVHPETNAVLAAYAQLGEDPAHTTSPGYAYIRAAIRSQTAQELQTLNDRIVETVTRTAKQYGLTSQAYMENTLPVTWSTDKEVDLLADSAKSMDLVVCELAAVNRWSDDFGHFTAKYPGVFFAIGDGKQAPQLHAPDLDFPDSNIFVAAKLYWKLVHNLNGI